MDFAGVVVLVGGVVGLLGGVAGILSWLNQRKQTAAVQDQLAIMREQVQATKQQEGSAVDWAKRFDQAADAIAKISPKPLNTAPSVVVAAYTFVFKDSDLRRRIEVYLGKRTRWYHKFIPVILSKEQLQNPVVQTTIQEVLDSVAQFKSEHNDFARALKLL